MALSVTDLVKGLDFTGFSSATAADHNALVDGATPILDTSEEGKGLVVWTVDSALNTPRVPDPTISSLHAKWKRYVWIRIPHSSSTSTVPLIYTWNDSATSVATYLKWQAPAFNTATMDAAITALDLRVDNIEASIVSIQSTANAANDNASYASQNASNALIIANAASAAATTAQATADDAVADAAAAGAKADAATLAATNATTIANNASASVTALAASVKFFTSSVVSLNSVAAAAALISEAHGLGAAPRQCRGVLVCTATDLGYAVNDEVDLASCQYFGSQPAFSVWSNSTNVGMSIQGSAGPNAIYVIGKAGTVAGYLDKSKWSVKVYAQL